MQLDILADGAKIAVITLSGAGALRLIVSTIKLIIPMVTAMKTKQADEQTRPCKQHEELTIAVAVIQQNLTDIKDSLKEMKQTFEKLTDEIFGRLREVEKQTAVHDKIIDKKRPQ